MLDLTEFVLDVLDGWDTSNYDPQPALVNGNDSTFYASPPPGYTAGDRTQDFDFTHGNLITVDNGPDRQQTPIGTEYDYDVEDGVTVVIQGAHESQHGHIADHDDFRTLVDEARRLIQADRRFPVSGDGEAYVSLQVDLESDNSHEYRDFYEYTFDVTFDGYEEL